MSLEDKIKMICNLLADEILQAAKDGEVVPRDAGMLLNNLSEYAIPKQQRTPITSRVSSDRNYKITYEYIEADTHGSTSDPDEGSEEV